MMLDWMVVSKTRSRGVTSTWTWTWSTRNTVPKHLFSLLLSWTVNWGIKGRDGRSGELNLFSKDQQHGYLIFTTGSALIFSSANSSTNSIWPFTHFKAPIQKNDSFKRKQICSHLVNPFKSHCRQSATQNDGHRSRLGDIDTVGTF